MSTARFFTSCAWCRPASRSRRPSERLRARAARRVAPGRTICIGARRLGAADRRLYAVIGRLVRATAGSCEKSAAEAPRRGRSSLGACRSWRAPTRPTTTWARAEGTRGWMLVGSQPALIPHEELEVPCERPMARVAAFARADALPERKVRPCRDRSSVRSDELCRARRPRAAP